MNIVDLSKQLKKRIDKYTYYELTNCKHLWCPCNKCKEIRPRPITIEKGLVKYGWVLGEWDCLLSEEDAEFYGQEDILYQQWNI